MTLTRQQAAIAEIPKGGASLPGGLRAAAKWLDVDPRKAYEEAKRGEWPWCAIAVRIGNVYVIPLPAWERFLRGELRPDAKSAANGDNR